MKPAKCRCVGTGHFDALDLGAPTLRPTRVRRVRELFGELFESAGGWESIPPHTGECLALSLVKRSGVFEAC
jgi:hypothetical protein